MSRDYSIFSSIDRALDRESTHDIASILVRLSIKEVPVYQAVETKCK